MTCQLFDTEILGDQAQVLLNDQFAGYNPGEAAARMTAPASRILH
ncbi:MAG TPA: hypothetical protein PLU16_08535 [Gallionellaceae bacterium]|jgi:hypothetical protein|nr:hypothetical protein [Gallionellaceae bacterium]HQS75243.1 hypothetical protein [Gallionellaceae bacterium]